MNSPVTESQFVTNPFIKANIFNIQTMMQNYPEYEVQIKNKINNVKLVFIYHKSASSKKLTKTISFSGPEEIAKLDNITFIMSEFHKFVITVNL